MKKIEKNQGKIQYKSGFESIQEQERTQHHLLYQPHCIPPAYFYILKGAISGLVCSAVVHVQNATAQIAFTFPWFQMCCHECLWSMTEKPLSPATGRRERGRVNARGMENRRDV